MELLSALVEAGSLPSELLQQMLLTDSAPTVKEQQVNLTCHIIKKYVLSLPNFLIERTDFASLLDVLLRPP